MWDKMVDCRVWGEDGGLKRMGEKMVDCRG